jgi:GT2 family glycosyltransferase
MSLDLSIVIPSHCRPDLLAACLSALFRHAPARTEVIVVDDGSIQGTVSEAARSFHGVRCIRLPRRRGFSAAANTGIRGAHGTVVELLNDDTEVAAAWSEAALPHFRDPAVAAVAPLVLRVGENSTTSFQIDSAGDRYYWGGVAGKRGRGAPVSSAYLRPCPVFGASASSAFYRRQALMEVGAFPETFGAYFEDVDLAFRLHWAGYQVVFEPAARVLHHVSASYRLPRRQLLEQQAHNEERVFWRNLPTPALYRALPSHCMVLAAKAWRRWREGTLLPFLCGKLRILGEVPHLARHRARLREAYSSTDMSSWHVDTEYWNSDDFFLHRT